MRQVAGELVLAPLIEADLAEVVRVMPADLELNPQATRFATGDGTHRGVVVHQEYWRSYGTWRPLAWAMRRAVLALAFDHLGARAAITSAWHDNTASRVSPAPLATDRTGTRSWAVGTPWTPCCTCE